MTPTISIADAILETLSEAVVVVDQMFRIVQLNAAAETLYEVSGQSMLGQPLPNLIGSVSGATITEGLETVMRGEVWRGQVWHQKPNGGRFLAEIKVRALTEGNLLVALVQDITEQHANALRGQVLGTALKIIADTESLGLMYRAVLECLLSIGGAEAVIFRSREADGYRVVDAAGLDQATLDSLRVVDFDTEEEALLRGEVLRIDLTHPDNQSDYVCTLNLGFTEAHLVGQRANGELIGTVALLYRGFNGVNLSPILPELAGALATQLERGRQLQGLSDRNRLLEWLRRLDRLNLEYAPINVLLGSLTEDLQSIFQVDSVAVGTVSASESAVVWYSHHREEAGSASSPLTGSLAEAVKHRRLTRCDEGSRQSLYVPVSNIEGTLVLSLRGRAGAFTPDQERDAQFIADQLALSLSRWRDRQRLVLERQSLEILAQVTSAMREASSQSQLFEIAADYALRTTRASTAIVLLADEARDGMSFAAIAGVNAEAMRGLPVTRQRGLSWRVLDTGKPRIEDIAAQLPEAHTVRPLAQGAYIGIPIFEGEGIQRRTVGVLTADTQADGARFQPTDLDYLTTISETLSSARARLEALEAAQQRAVAFARLAQLSSDLELLDDDADIARRGLEALLSLTGLEAAAHFTHQDGHLTTTVTVGNFPAGYVAEREITAVRRGTGMFGKALETGQVQIAGDYQSAADAVEIAKKFNFRTALVAPIVLNGTVRAFLGAASLSKTISLPPNALEVAEFLARRVSRAMERADQIGEILFTRASSFRTLGRALEMRDFETKGHTDRVVKLSLQLGRALQLTDTQMQHLEWGALLHDIGKIAISDSILLKPGKLTPEEWKIIREHPEIGYRMLEDLHFLPRETLEVVRYHQEREDGSGYPEARRGAEIPYLARLFAVVDVFDALISRRPYKNAWSLDEAVSELRDQAGQTLNAELIATFLATIEHEGVL